jgi:hypothetical protein
MKTALSLDPNAEPYSITREELFNKVVNIVLHPHTVVTQIDRKKAAAIFLALSNYLDNYTQCQEDIGCWVDVSEATDFEGYALSLFGKGPNFDPITAEELLK